MRSARLRPVSVFLTTLALATTAAVAAPASSAAPRPEPTAFVTVDGHKVVKGTIIGEWGKTADGQAFSYTYTAGDAKPAEAASSAAAAAICSVYISDVGFYGAGSSAYFQWETSHACSGSYGSQKLQTQMWRSSWSGPRGYNSWTGTSTTTSNFIDYGWSVDCNDGGGTYDYYPVMQGYASGIGWGPKTRSDNQLRKNCGTSAP
ncbi:hypothetical protein [Streptomyces sp. NBC_01264]|uniref:hypothetical protein n=1 Tax=Streptomyces sp. NBC_01264 TaxID=2903804 RepID=UPI00225660B0|nr:hypothetical protein [Streptomyces sp. NBC_01264]MCX4781510.1 hypothetical protein [Streptomyces sp. NBC_01264]